MVSGLRLIAKRGSGSGIGLVGRVLYVVLAKLDQTLDSRDVFPGDQFYYSLAGDARAVPQIEAQHTLYLEDRGLAPGDLIAYHLRTTDADDDPARSIATDVYFMQVRPFDRNYRRARGGGGSGGGQGADVAAK